MLTLIRLCYAFVKSLVLICCVCEQLSLVNGIVAAL